MGLDESDIDLLMRKIKVRAGLAETWTDTLATLAHQLPVSQYDSICRNGGLFAFVGPSGAGKTATLSKIATRFVLSKPKAKLSIVVLENENAKQSPLVRLGSILDVPVRCVSDRTGLVHAIAAACNDHLVLIDTPSCRFQAKSDAVRDALVRLPQIEKILVLPANAQAKSLASTVANYQSIGVNSCVLSKLDDCAIVGEVMSILLQAQLAVSYLSSGENISSDFRPARGYHLVTQAVSLLKKEQTRQMQVPLSRKYFQTSRQSLSA